MSDTSPKLIDAVFDVSGDTLPAAYPFALWHALLHHLPLLASDHLVGVVPLRTTHNEAGMLLPKRAKLVLRIPMEMAEHAASLAMQQLDLEGSTLQLGNLKLRPLQPYPTLHAHLVSTDDEEVQFIEQVNTRLTELGIVANLICGMRNQLETPQRKIQGYSLVIHDLKPEASLRLQYTGLGADRHYGCGIFVPYKAITDLD
ncbi:MAG: type I-MYXAN CRISPR-associated protein Cas6/Cmx6 [Gallionella sp.]|nr:type I-MYXAN CRISPR-associated protein Cas6/Cmx6 [Gallionella sp.]